MKRIHDSDGKVTLACILTSTALCWLPGTAAQGLVLEEVIVTAQIARIGQLRITDTVL
jgi:hypothetical protein